MAAGRYKKSSIRLAYTEYGTSQIAQSLARSLFLRIVAEMVPGVLTGLQADVLPVYKAVAEDIGCYMDPIARESERAECRELRDVPDCAVALSGEEPHDWPTVELSGMPLAGSVGHSDLLPERKELEAWAKTHHVCAPWVLDQASEQVHLWLWAPPAEDGAAGLQWYGLGVRWRLPPVNPRDDRFTFEHYGWNPMLRTRSQFKETIRANFDLRLREYLDAIETSMAAADGVGRSKEYRSLQQHLEWLVRYQVKRENWPDIAATADRELSNGRRVPVSADYVAKATKAVAELLGLTLDPVRGRGRPIGSETKSTTGNHVTPESRRR